MTRAASSEPQTPSPSLGAFARAFATATANARANFRGQFLLATPALIDPRFNQSVIYLCDHTAAGALGIIINKPATMKMVELFEQVKLECKSEAVRSAQVFLGGPVQSERGFVLHEHLAGKRCLSTLDISTNLQMTSSRDVLEILAQDPAAPRALVALGYAGWGAGQLEEEIANNAWLTLAPSQDFVHQTLFETAPQQRFARTLAELGIAHSATLSLVAGQA